MLEQRHPAVIETLRLLWGYPELNQYFEKVYSGRDSSLNFAPDAMAELMVLAQSCIKGSVRIAPRPQSMRCTGRAAGRIPGRPRAAASSSLAGKLVAASP